MEQETRYTKVCPNCGNKLGFSSNQTTVHCQCCDSDFSTAELLASSSSVHSATFAQENIDSNESGLAYLDSIFGTMDWDDFCTNNPSLFVESVSAVVDKMKVKFANQPQTWLFEFKSILIPLQKRFEFMDKTLDEIAGKDVDLEDEASLSKYDCYNLCVELLLKGKERVKKTLAIDLEMMKKFKLDSSSLKEATSQCEAVIKQIEGVKESTSIYDLEVVKAKTKKKEEEVISKYRIQGINVVETYERALKEYLFGNKTDALKHFSSISEYRDCAKYILKLKKVNFAFDKKLVEFAGVNYLYCANSPDDPVGEKKGCSLKKKAAPTTSITQTFVGKKLSEFRPIVDGVKGEKPVLKNIARLIMAYGDMLYYINSENMLVGYDFARKISTTLMDLKDCKVDDESLFCYRALGKFVFLAPMEKSKQGCFKKLFGKKKQTGPVIARYRLAIVDCLNCTVSYHGQDILCITDTYSTKIFYTQGILNRDGEIEKKKYIVFDIETEKAICPFNREVFIYNVVDNFIIYGLWMPNGLNVDLYSYNLDTTEITLLEKNAYDIARYGRGEKKLPLTIDGYVYYTVGNEDFSPLYRVKPDGSDKKEIMSNVETINFIRNGYFYITKYIVYNVGTQRYFYRTLVKSKADGSKTTYVCSGFRRVVAFKQGYIYYVDNRYRLCIVRADGEQDRVISNRFERELLINDKNIFFLYNEDVDKHKNGYSIYVMDLQGNNMHKIAFNVEEAEYYDENNIYYSVEDVLSYSVKVPKNHREYKEPVVKDYDVTMYYALNVNDLHLTRLYVENAPEFDKGKAAKGCKLFHKSTLPTLATQVEHIFPMPEKTKVSYVENKTEDATANSNKKAAPGCDTKKMGCGSKKGCAPMKGGR